MIRVLAEPRTVRLPAPTMAVAVGAFGALAVGAAVSVINPIYALIGLLAAGVVVGTAFLPMGRFWLLAGVITLLPFGVIPVNIGVQLGMLDAICALLIGVALLRFLARSQAGVATPVDLPILGYLALACVSFVAGFGVTTVTGEDVRYFLKLLMAISLFFVLTNSLTTRDKLHSFVSALAIGAFGSALLALLLQLAGPGTAGRLLSSLGPLGYPTGADCGWNAAGSNTCGVLRYIANSNVWRATSTSVDPNIFGGLLMVGIILMLGRLLARPSKRNWRLGVPMLAVMSWAFLLSYSRGAWVGLAAGLFFLALLRYRKALPAVIALAFVALLVLGQTEFGKHLVEGFMVDDQATGMRVGEYQDALHFIAEYPLFGVGYGFYAQWRSGVHLPGEIYVGVSNIYLLMTLEVGVVGMAAFGSVVGTLGLWLRRRWSAADSEGQTWMAAAAAALVAAGIAGLADHYFAIYPHMVALLWSLIAIATVAGRLASPAASADLAQDHRKAA